MQGKIKDKKIKKWAPLRVLALIMVVSLACGESVSPTLVAAATPAESASQDQPAQAVDPVSQQVYKVGDLAGYGDHVLTVVAREARRTFLLLDPNLPPVNKMSHYECRSCLASSIRKS